MLKHEFDKPRHPARVVILGSAGFVAAATRDCLDAAGVPVVALPRTQLDLTDKAAADRLVGLLRPDDALLFASAQAPVKNDAMLLANLQMAAAVCDALTQVSPCHVVYISSDAVYADSDAPLTEGSCAEPGSLHGVMHLAREVMLRNAYDGALCFLRPTLIYGAADPHNGYGPNRFLRIAATGGDIVLFGEGEERRDHVYIDDVATVATGVLLHRSRGVLNIATGETTSFRAIADFAAKMVGKHSVVKGSPRLGPMPHNGYRAFDSSASYAAFPEFRYTPLAEGMARILQARAVVVPGGAS